MWALGNASRVTGFESPGRPPTPVVRYHLPLARRGLSAPTYSITYTAAGCRHGDGIRGAGEEGKGRGRLGEGVRFHNGVHAPYPGTSPIAPTLTTPSPMGCGSSVQPATSATSAAGKGKGKGKAQDTTAAAGSSHQPAGATSTEARKSGAGAGTAACAALPVSLFAGLAGGVCGLFLSCVGAVYPSAFALLAAHEAALAAAFNGGGRGSAVLAPLGAPAPCPVHGKSWPVCMGQFFGAARVWGG